MSNSGNRSRKNPPPVPIRNRESFIERKVPVRGKEKGGFSVVKNENVNEFVEDLPSSMKKQIVNSLNNNSNGGNISSNGGGYTTTNPSSQNNKNKVPPKLPPKRPLSIKAFKREIGKMKSPPLVPTKRMSRKVEGKKTGFSGSGGGGGVASSKNKGKDERKIIKRVISDISFEKDKKKFYRKSVNNEKKNLYRKSINPNVERNKKNLIMKEKRKTISVEKRNKIRQRVKKQENTFSQMENTNTNNNNNEKEDMGFLIIDKQKLPFNPSQLPPRPPKKIPLSSDEPTTGIKKFPDLPIPKRTTKTEREISESIMAAANNNTKTEVGKRKWCNSLLISKSMKDIWVKDFLFSGKLSFKGKSLGAKKWKDYLCILTKDRTIEFYPTSTKKFQSLGADDNEKSSFILNLDSSSFEKKNNLVIQLNIKSPKKKRVLLRSPTNVLFNEWVTYFIMLGVEEEKPKKSNTVQLFKKWFKEGREGSFSSKKYLYWTKAELIQFFELVKIDFYDSIWDMYSDKLIKVLGKNMNGQMFHDKILSRDILTVLEEELVIDNEQHIQVMHNQFIRIYTSGYFNITEIYVFEKLMAMFERRGATTDKPFISFLNYGKNFHRKDLVAKTIKQILTKYEENGNNYGLSNGEPKRYKVKFIMTENLQNRNAKKLRKLIGVPLNLATKVGITDIKFGMFHAALSIGPLQMEWVDNSLVLLRSISSEKVLLCVDIGYYDVQDLQKFCDTLGQEVVNWNRDFFYDTTNFNKKKYHANCQQFVEYIIVGVLNLELKFSREIENFMKNMKDYGNTSMVFSYSNEFGAAFELKGNSIKFEKHQELDDFVLKCKENHENFSVRFPEEWDLLKGFDRAFWMKYFQQVKLEQKKLEASGQEVNKNSMKEIKVECDYSPSGNGCPFNEENN